MSREKELFSGISLALDAVPHGGAKCKYTTLPDRRALCKILIPCLVERSNKTELPTGCDLFRNQSMDVASKPDCDRALVSLALPPKHSIVINWFLPGVSSAPTSVHSLLAETGDTSMQGLACTVEICFDSEIPGSLPWANKVHCFCSSRFLLGHLFQGDCL